MDCAELRSTKLLLEGICEVRAKVPVAVGRVRVPTLDMDEMTGAALKVFWPVIDCGVVKSTKLLAGTISEVRARVPEVVGSVSVPMLRILEITGGSMNVLAPSIL
jgi:hypothetical protein